MKRWLASLIAVTAFILMAGCGGGSKTPSSSTISISPATSSIQTGTTLQFTLTPATGVTVNWQVNGTIGGDLDNGTISQLGLYTAPAILPKKNPVTVTAVSSTDATVTASASITITQGPAVTVSVSPATASVGTSQSAQFTATVTNTANTAVYWEVNNVVGGNSTNGTIDGNGVYTAPATVPSTATVTITALSQADPSKSASATLTITPFSFVAVAPSSVTLLAGATQTFTATISGAPANVTWSVGCDPQALDCGSITAAGVYTAPLSPPPGGVVMITAKPVNPNLANPGGAVATITFGNGSLKGQYAFTLSGRSAAGPFTAAASLDFNGANSVTVTAEDLNGPGAPASVTGWTGTYNVGTDGRGVIALQNGGATVNFQVALINHSHGYILGFDSGTGTAAGALDLQDPTAFTTASINGSYALNLIGMNAGGAAGSLAMAGVLPADGANAITQGLLDVNSAGAINAGGGVGAPLTPTGAYSSPSSGRGTLTITSGFGTQTFAYYIVDASHVKLIETDANHFTIGDLVKQAAGPFTVGSFTGGYAFTFAGSSSQVPLGEGGVFTLDGAGAVSTGTLDRNAGGTVANALSLTGSYAVANAVTGRTTATLNVGGNSRTYVFYPQSGNALSMVEADALNTAAGLAFQQAVGTFTQASVQGNYALRLGGTDLVTNPGVEGMVGQLQPNGSAALAGMFDINDAGVTARSAVISGSYAVTSVNGRGTASMQSDAAPLRTASNLFNIYIIDSNRVLLLETDSNRVLVGVMSKQ